MLSEHPGCLPGVLPWLRCLFPGELAGEQHLLVKSSGGKEPSLLKLLFQCLISSRTSSAGLFHGMGVQHLIENADISEVQIMELHSCPCVFYLLANSIEQTVLGNTGGL